MSKWLPIVLLALGCGASTSPPVAEPRTEPEPVVQENKLRRHQLKDLERRTIELKGKKVEVWIMDSASKIQEGMMWLRAKDVKDDEGMLFVMPDSRQQSFWMANCPLGLDIGFISPGGKLLNIQNGKPFDESPLPSKGPAKYVLEMKAGSLKRLGVVPGDSIPIPKGLSYKG